MFARRASTRALLGNPRARRARPARLGAPALQLLLRTANHADRGSTSRATAKARASRAPPGSSRPPAPYPARRARKRFTKQQWGRAAARPARRVTEAGCARAAAVLRRATAASAAPGPSCRPATVWTAPRARSQRRRTLGAAFRARRASTRPRRSRSSATNACRAASARAL